MNKIEVQHWRWKNASDESMNERSPSTPISLVTVFPVSGGGGGHAWWVAWLDSGGLGARAVRYASAAGWRPSLLLSSSWTAPGTPPGWRWISLLRCVPFITCIWHPPALSLHISCEVSEELELMGRVLMCENFRLSQHKDLYIEIINLHSSELKQ